MFLPKILTEYCWNYALWNKNKCNGESSKKGIYLSVWMLTFWEKKTQKSALIVHEKIF